MYIDMYYVRYAHIFVYLYVYKKKWSMKYFENALGAVKSNESFYECDFLTSL